ncbi:hypothetical protein OH492_26205 [Vibrio chagasii]|nr:hypothetical protein [Vibrio chagasii]
MFSFQVVCGGFGIALLH